MDRRIYIPEGSDFHSPIRALWQVTYATGGKQETILPKGVIEIVFQLNTDEHASSSQRSLLLPIPRVFINGFNTKPIIFQPPRHSTLFGVRFNPVAVNQFFGERASQFGDRLIDATDVDETVNRVWHQLAETDTFQKRVAVILQWVKPRTVELHQREILLNQFLVKNELTLSARQLGETLCYSSRQVSRKLVDISGLNGEQMLLYKKYLYAVDLMHQTDLSLTQIAFRCHFSDQGHFTKTFRNFTDMTPKAYRQAKDSLPGHVIKDVR